MIIDDVKGLEAINANISKCQEARDRIQTILQDDPTEMKITTGDGRMKFNELLSPEQLEEIVITILAHIETNQNECSVYLESIQLPARSALLTSVLDKNNPKQAKKQEKKENGPSGQEKAITA